MKNYLLAAGLLFGTAGTHAGTIDFTDNSFAGTPTYAFGGSGPIIAFSESADGADLSFSGGQFRALGPWGSGMFADGTYSLQFGGGAGNTASFSLIPSIDIFLNSYTGLGGASGNLNAIFNITGLGVNSIGNTFVTQGFDGHPGETNAFTGGPLLLQAGEAYQFVTTNASANTIGRFYSFDVAAAGGQVPLPAGLPLFLMGFGMLVALRARSQ